MLSWEGRRGAHSPAGSLHPVHSGSPPVPSCAISHCITATQGDQGPELDTHSTHHPPSPVSVRDANPAGAYRQIVTRLPGFTFPS